MARYLKEEAKKEGTSLDSAVQLVLMKQIKNDQGRVYTHIYTYGYTEKKEE